MKRAAIFGAAGAIGRVLGAELDRRGVPFRAVGRDARRLQEAFGALTAAEITPADSGDSQAAAAAARGVDTIFYTVGVPYTEFARHPVLMRTAVEAAVTTGVERIIVVSSVYSYGVPETPRVPETHPRLPETFKGRMRKEQEDIALEAQKQGRILSMVVRLPDFYGPFANDSLANPVFAAALAGKKANWIGPVNTPHEFVFVPDAAPAIVDLAACPDCYGQAWNYGGPGEITAIDFITRIYRAAGRAPKYRTAGRTLLTIMGWFKPFFRELTEMLYLQETPVILDDSKFRAKFPAARKTSYDEGIRKTLDWMR